MEPVEEPVEMPAEATHVFEPMAEEAPLETYEPPVELEE